MTLDEAAICENHVGKRTLYFKGLKVNRREGAGKRLCMGCAGIYWSDGSGNARNDEIHAKTLDFFMFPAGGVKGQSRSGPSAAEYKEDIKRLILPHTRIAAAGIPGYTKMPTGKQELKNLYGLLTKDIMADDTTNALLEKMKRGEDMEASSTDSDIDHDTFDYVRAPRCCRCRSPAVDQVPCFCCLSACLLSACPL